MTSKNVDAVVIGAGPNGLAAAITLQLAGISVLVIERNEKVGGGLRTAELTLPGFKHDVCSAVHPLAIASPFFKKLPLSDYGLEFIQPTISAAHPFDDGKAVTLERSLIDTADSLGHDRDAYLNLMSPTVGNWDELIKDILSPLKMPGHPIELLRFGLTALRSAQDVSGKFTTQKARGLWAGMAAHSIQPFQKLTTSAAAMVLLAAGHKGGWPIAKGGSQSIADALAGHFIALGGKIETGIEIKSLADIPPTKVVLFDLTPRQILNIAGEDLSAFYKWQLNRYQSGSGVFKIDWALSEPAPFTAPACKSAGTIHLGNSFEEISLSEEQVSKGIYPAKPFVLFTQPSVFDCSRAPVSKHTAWAYCHVPFGSTIDMTAQIENQVERFAPGFKEVILAKSTMNTLQLEQYNPNYIGGDINGGAFDITQLFSRPALRFSPYRTSSRKFYICSSSTPPGGGVHGMCGYYAAKRALKDIFGLQAIAI
ncbi:NAD(P)-binding protein [Pedobacter sp. HMF7647]|uniref:NAD(P)-binding protein n=1 Tax=Hufsiella arboris TaxID=2695275 RepID=A0A7K1YCS0_9SPHI|nr:NAD(P)/FAD-dependent oxidoreductase [Hufsiella arboris]MXV52382.1 NAD(P)-binding protein [Hufsiella arboris]